MVRKEEEGVVRNVDEPERSAAHGVGGAGHTVHRREILAKGAIGFVVAFVGSSVARAQGGGNLPCGSYNQFHQLVNDNACGMGGRDDTDACCGQNFTEGGLPSDPHHGDFDCGAGQGKEQDFDCSLVAEGPDHHHGDESCFSQTSDISCGLTATTTEVLEDHDCVNPSGSDGDCTEPAIGGGHWADGALGKS